MARPLPRKIPQQERSRRLYDGIVDAAGRILLTSGYDGVTTHRIAEEADVSPGSVYQYFPNKDAIVHEAVDRIVAKIGERLATAVTEFFEADPGQSLRKMVEATLAVTEEHRELARFVTKELPRLGGSDAITEYERQAMYLARGFLSATSGRAAVDAAASARVWVATSMLQHLVTSYVSNQPSIDRTAFVDAMVVAIESLLSPSKGELAT